MVLRMNIRQNQSLGAECRLEGFSRDGNGHASEVLITGRFAQSQQNPQSLRQNSHSGKRLCRRCCGRGSVPFHLKFPGAASASTQLI